MSIRTMILVMAVLMLPFMNVACDDDDDSGNNSDNNSVNSGNNSGNSGNNSGTSVCGNGTVDGTEQCDGTSFNGVTCQSLGFDGGVLLCSPQCTLDTSSCSPDATGTPVCGNGTVDGTEQCDGTSFNGVTCQSLGFDGGTLVCSADCRLDTSECTNEPPGPVGMGTAVYYTPQPFIVIQQRVSAPDGGEFLAVRVIGSPYPLPAQEFDHYTPYLMKIGASGRTEYSALLDSDVDIVSMGVDSAGNLYVLTDSSTVMKYSPDLSSQYWIHEVQGQDLDLTSMQVSGSGDVYAVGSAADDAFVIKLDSSGNEVWRAGWGAAGRDTVTAITLDGTGVFVAGFTSSVGGAAASGVPFVYVLTTDGTIQSGGSFGQYANDRPAAIKRMDDGSLAVASTMNDAITVHIVSSTADQMIRTGDATCPQYRTCMAVDMAVDGGNIYVLGEAHYDAEQLNGGVSTLPYSELMVEKYAASSGDVVAQFRGTRGSYTAGVSISALPSGDVHVVLTAKDEIIDVDGVYHIWNVGPYRALFSGGDIASGPAYTSLGTLFRSAAHANDAAVSHDGQIHLVGGGYGISRTTGYPTYLHDFFDCMVTAEAKIDPSQQSVTQDAVSRHTSVYDSDNDSEIKGITVNSGGDIFYILDMNNPRFICGSSYGSPEDVVVVGYDSSGNSVLCYDFGDMHLMGKAHSSDIQAVSDGVMAVGLIKGDFTEASNMHNPSSAYFSTFIAKFDSSNTLRWGYQYNSVTRNTEGVLTEYAVEAVRVCEYVPGHYLIAANTNYMAVSSDATTGTDVMLISMSDPASLDGTAMLGDEGDDYVTAMICDGTTVYLAGHTSGVMGDGTPMAGTDAFLVQTDPSGNTAWIRRLGTDGDDNITAITVMPDGDILVAGTTTGAFPGYLHPHWGVTDAFIASFAPDGSMQWVYQISSSEGFVKPVKFVQDQNGTMWLTGTVHGALEHGDMAWGEQMFAVPLSFLN